MNEIKSFKTEQEKIWAGNFGDEYVIRNTNMNLVASNVHVFSTILARTHSVSSVIEFGANIGLVIRALKALLPHADMSALEINDKAVQELKQIVDLKVYNQSLLDFAIDRKRDFVFTKALLIHISPEFLSRAYEILYQTSNRWICLLEFYNPTPTNVVYRGHSDCLFKRDFAGEMMDQFKDLRLVDYGFFYHRDPVFPQGDLNWFLLEKTNSK